MLYSNSVRNTISYIGISKPPSNLTNNFKEFNITKRFYISENKHNIKYIIKVKCCCEITNVDVIRTPTGVAYDGNVLTGIKVFFSGIIKAKVHYSIYEDSKVYYDEIKIPFSESFPLKDKYSFYFTPENISTFVIDVTILKLSDREVFLSIILLTKLDKY